MYISCSVTYGYTLRQRRGGQGIGKCCTYSGALLNMRVAEKAL